MADLPSIGGALCESLAIPFLVPRRKVWLTPAAGVPCSNAANIAERKTRSKVNFARGKILSGGKSPRKCIYIYIVAAQEMPQYRLLQRKPINRKSSTTRNVLPEQWNEQLSRDSAARLTDCSASKMVSSDVLECWAGSLERQPRICTDHRTFNE